MAAAHNKEIRLGHEPDLRELIGLEYDGLRNDEGWIWKM